MTAWTPARRKAWRAEMDAAKAAKAAAKSSGTTSPRRNKAQAPAAAKPRPSRLEPTKPKLGPNPPDTIPVSTDTLGGLVVALANADVPFAVKRSREPGEAYVSVDRGNEEALRKARQQAERPIGSIHVEHGPDGWEWSAFVDYGGGYMVEYRGSLGRGARTKALDDLLAALDESMAKSPFPVRLPDDAKRVRPWGVGRDHFEWRPGF